MVTIEQCKKELSDFKNSFGSELGINRIGVFGSVARGEQTEDSDIDIVVDVVSPTMYVMYSIQERLTEIFHCEVDVVRYRDSLRPLLKQNIDKEAIYV